MFPSDERRPHRSLTSQDDPGTDFVLGLQQLGVGHPFFVDALVDFFDAVQIGGRVFRVAAEVGEVDAAAVEFVVAELRGLCITGIDDLPIQPAAGVVPDVITGAEQGPPRIASGVGAEGARGEVHHVLLARSSPW